MKSEIASHAISVIIPTYNRSWGLKLAIESVLVQGFRDYELIVVDDCSTDDTVESVEKFDDDRIRFYRQEQNVGMVANWGTGLRLAKGEFVSFLMDDDQLRPEFLGNRLPHLMADQNVVAVFSQHDICDLEGNLISVHNQNKQSKQRLISNDLLAAVLSRQWFVGAALYQKAAVIEAWEAVSQDDLVLDFGLNIQLALRKEAVGIYIPENDFIMSVHPGQNSQAKLTQVFSQTSTLLTQLLKQKIDVSRHSMIKRELAQWYVVWGRSLAGEGQIQTAQRHFLKALSVEPRLIWA